jgi:hypothetical protein
VWPVNEGGSTFMHYWIVSTTPAHMTRIMSFFNVGPAPILKYAIRQNTQQITRDFWAFIYED